jgi:hypothetical protein
MQGVISASNPDAVNPSLDVCGIRRSHLSEIASRAKADGRTRSFSMATASRTTRRRA